MSSRDKILAAVKVNQPQATALPDLGMFQYDSGGAYNQFVQTLTNIGGTVVNVKSWDEISTICGNKYAGQRMVSPIAELNGFERVQRDVDPHALYDIELAVIKAHFGVAENGAVWVTESLMGVRVLPFITQHLAVVIKASDVVPTMNEAYDRIAQIPPYSFASFIAGPSKTADIEQSLVIGAHGPRSMTVFILG
jgi:L-lactate dehydrogenase complex protein LldG